MPRDKTLHDLRVAQQISNPVDPNNKFVGGTTLHMLSANPYGNIIPPTYARTLNIHNRSFYPLGISVGTPASATILARVIPPNADLSMSFAAGVPTLSYIYLPTAPNAFTMPSSANVEGSTIVISYYIP
mgnify:CR=1 FL=1|jgi:hypothetical protein